jgi:hypothetical protein
LKCCLLLSRCAQADEKSEKVLDYRDNRDNASADKTLDGYYYSKAVSYMFAKNIEIMIIHAAFQDKARNILTVAPKEAAKG